MAGAVEGASNSGAAGNPAKNDPAMKSMTSRSETIQGFVFSVFPLTVVGGDANTSALTHGGEVIGWVRCRTYGVYEWRSAWGVSRWEGPCATLTHAKDRLVKTWLVERKAGVREAASVCPKCKQPVALMSFGVGGPALLDPEPVSVFLDDGTLVRGRRPHSETCCAR